MIIQSLVGTGQGFLRKERFRVECFGWTVLLKEKKERLSSQKEWSMSGKGTVEIRSIWPLLCRSFAAPWRLTYYKTIHWPFFCLSLEWTTKPKVNGAVKGTEQFSVKIKNWPSFDNSFKNHWYSIFEYLILCFKIIHILILQYSIF